MDQLWGIWVCTCILQCLQLASAHTLICLFWTWPSPPSSTMRLHCLFCCQVPSLLGESNTHAYTELHEVLANIYLTIWLHSIAKQSTHTLDLFWICLFLNVHGLLHQDFTISFAVRFYYFVHEVMLCIGWTHTWGILIWVLLIYYFQESAHTLDLSNVAFPHHPMRFH